MNMHEGKKTREDLHDQLTAAKEEIDNLREQIKCLLDLTKNAWRGDQASIVHLAELIGIDPEMEQNAFGDKKPTTPALTKKTVTVVDNEEVVSKYTPSIASSISHEDRLEQKRPRKSVQTQAAAAARNTYLQPFLKQNHIDPIREQNSRQLLVNMMRYRQHEIRHSPSIPSRASSANVRPRATKHLYHLASPDHVVRHLGSPSSRTKPYFVFAGKEFFQQTSSYAPSYERGFITSNGSQYSEQSDTTEEFEAAISPAAEPAVARPQTAKLPQRSPTVRSSVHSKDSDSSGRATSAKLTTISERERRDAMRLQQQLNLPRQGWVNQHC